MNGVPVTIDSIIADITIDAENGITWNPELYRKELEKLVTLSAIPEGWIDVEKELPEEYQNVLWCKMPIVEPPYCGSMLDEYFQHCYFTHWHKLPNPPLLNTNKI